MHHILSNRADLHHKPTRHLRQDMQTMKNYLMMRTLHQDFRCRCVAQSFVGYILTMWGGKSESEESGAHGSDVDEGETKAMDEVVDDIEFDLDEDDGSDNAVDLDVNGMDSEDDALDA